MLQEGFGVGKLDGVWMEIRPRDRLYHLALKYIAEQSKSVKSFAPVPLRRGAERLSTFRGRNDVAFEGLQLGIGTASFEHQVGGQLYKVRAMHQRRGPVVGTSMEAIMWQSLVLLVEGCQDHHVLEDLSRKIADQELRARESEFAIYRFDAQRAHWNLEGVQRAREMSSVILEPSLKQKLLHDIEEFLDPTTQEWYIRHGVPYRRCYLLHGPPGTGKTSFMQAVAGKHRLNLCVLQPDPMLTDLKLLQAMRDAPPQSVVALEDIDSLLARTPKNLVSFSGILNALDGVANGDGRIFMLTTNHRDTLDPTLVRKGRVDVDVQFSGANADTIRAMFLHFYPGADGPAQHFQQGLLNALDGAPISMAALQDFFVRHRHDEAAAAAERWGEFKDQTPSTPNIGRHGSESSVGRAETTHSSASRASNSEGARIPSGVDCRDRSENFARNEAPGRQDGHAGHRGFSVRESEVPGPSVFVSTNVQQGWS